MLGMSTTPLLASVFMALALFQCPRAESSLELSAFQDTGPIPSVRTIRLDACEDFATDPSPSVTVIDEFTLRNSSSAGINPIIELTWHTVSDRVRVRFLDLQVLDRHDRTRVVVEYLGPPVLEEIKVRIEGSSNVGSPRGAGTIHRTFQIVDCGDVTPPPDTSPGPACPVGGILFSYGGDAFVESGIVAIADETGGAPCTLISPELLDDGQRGALPAEPAVSPDQNTVAYVLGRFPEQGALMLYDVGSGAKSELATGEFHDPEFSPNGRWLACTWEQLDPSGSYFRDIAIFDLASGERTTFSDGSKPTWAPGSDKIAFLPTLSGSLQEVATVQVTDEGTGTPPTFAATATEILSLSGSGASIGELKWSNDGDKIAFTARSQGPVTEVRVNRWRLHVFRPDDPDAFELVPVTTTADPADHDRFPVWLDNERIVFFHDLVPTTDANDIEKRLEIVTVALADDGSGKVVGTAQQPIELLQYAGGPPIADRMVPAVSRGE